MKQIKQYKWTIVAVILILIAILMPGNDVPSVGIPHLDKVVHFGMFGVLALVFYGEYTWQHKKLPVYLKAWGAMEIFALVTEFMQKLVPGRSCDMIDFVADSLGITLMIALFIIVLEKKFISHD